MQPGSHVSLAARPDQEPVPVIVIGPHSQFPSKGRGLSTAAFCINENRKKP